MKTGFSIVGVSARTGVASGQLFITEASMGLEREDVTEDWFELTNVGGVVPAPASLALVGLEGLVAGRRR